MLMIDDILSDVVGDVDFMTVEQLKQEIGWPLDYTSTIGIAPYIRRMGNDISGIEIGTARGEGSYFLLENCPNIKTLHTIDPYKEFVDWIGVIRQEVLDKQKEIAQQNFSCWGSRINQIIATSDEAKTSFEDNSMDFLFVDGDHSADNVCKDLHNYYSKVKKNGIIAGSNYKMETVRDGLYKWRAETKNTYPISTTTNNVWFFYRR